MRKVAESLVLFLLVWAAALADGTFFSHFGLPAFSVGALSVLIVGVNIVERNKRMRGIWMAGVGGIFAELMPQHYIPLDVPGASFLWFLFLAILIKYIVKEYVQVPIPARGR